MKDLISVIVPIYNSGNSLVRCIDSLINQSYSNLEIILVNDGSTDNSLDICNLYKEKDNRIKVVDKRNGGCIDSRLKGIDISKGKYIGFVDSDDYIDKDMYNLLYNSLINNDSDLAVCNVYKVYNDDKELQNHGMSNNVLTGVKLEELKSQFLPNKKNKGEALKFYMWNKLFKRDLLLSSLIEIDKEVSVFEDLTICFPCLIQANSISFVEQPCYYYVYNNMSILHFTNYKKELTSVYKAINVVKKQCEVLRVKYDYDFDFILLNVVRHLLSYERNRKLTKEKFIFINEFLKENNIHINSTRFILSEKIKMALFKFKMYGLLIVLLKIKNN